MIAATNRPEAIDEALRRRPLRAAILVGVPDEPGRREILGIHTRGMPLAADVDLGDLARRHGFVGADLAALTREAALETSQRWCQAEPRRGHHSNRGARRAVGRAQRLRRNALKKCQPSAMREVMVEARLSAGTISAASTHRATGGGRAPAATVRCVPAARHPGPPRASSYGPPGTGETLLGQEAAREAQANFIATKSSDLLHKWYGESEQQIARLLPGAVAPTIIFIDELDSPRAGARRRIGRAAGDRAVINTILAEMDGLEELQNVVVIGARSFRPADADRPGAASAGPFRRAGGVSSPTRLAAPGSSRSTRRDMLAKDVDLDGLGTARPLHRCRP